MNLLHKIEVGGGGGKLFRRFSLLWARAHAHTPLRDLRNDWHDHAEILQVNYYSNFDEAEALIGTQ